jgi:hypothetical protein
MLQNSMAWKQEVIKNFDNPKIKFSPAFPTAFTEKGLYMLATILKSKRATKATIDIVEAFAKLRELTRTLIDIKNKQLMKECINHYLQNPEIC